MLRGQHLRAVCFTNIWRESDLAHMIGHMTYSQTLAAEIRAEAARKRISGRDLSRYLAENGNDLSHGTIARMMRGERPWDVDSLSLAARCLDVSIVDLIERAGDAMAESR